MSPAALLLLIVLAPLLLGAQATPVCDRSAEALSPAEEYTFADAVLVGEVKNVEKDVVGQDGPQDVATIELSGAWKQALTGQVQVRTDGGGCGVPFQAGQQWVVYAYEVDGGLYAPANGNTVRYDLDSASLDPIRDVRPHAGAAIPEDFGDTNILVYVVVAYVIFFGLGAIFYYVSKHFVRR